MYLDLSYLYPEIIEIVGGASNYTHVIKKKKKNGWK